MFPGGVDGNPAQAITWAICYVERAVAINTISNWLKEPLRNRLDWARIPSVCGVHGHLAISGVGLDNVEQRKGALAIPPAGGAPWRCTTVQNLPVRPKGQLWRGSSTRCVARCRHRSLCAAAAQERSRHGGAKGKVTDTGGFHGFSVVSTFSARGCSAERSAALASRNFTDPPEPSVPTLVALARADIMQRL